MESKHKATIYADVGGTNTRIWSKGRGKVSELVVGMRGVWTSAEKAKWKKKLSGIAPRVVVLSDIELAHHLSFGTGMGIVLNAGTGSIAFGRNNKGQSARSGGLGPLVGDDGSAFWIGREYLRMRNEMGADLKEIRAYVTGPDAVAKIAGLAKKVLRIAERKPKSFERRIVQEAFLHLNYLMKDVRMRLKLAPMTPLHLTGGLFKNKFFRSEFLRFASGR